MSFYLFIMIYRVNIILSKTSIRIILCLFLICLNVGDIWSQEIDIQSKFNSAIIGNDKNDIKYCIDNGARIQDFKYLNKLTVAQARIFKELAIEYYKSGQPDKTEDCLKYSIEIYKAISTDLPLECTEALIILSNLYDKQGKYSLSLPLLQLTLKIQQYHLGEMTVDFARTVNRIGSKYYLLGDFQSAEKYMLRSLYIRKTILGEKNNDYLTTLNNLGVLYVDYGYFSKADSCLRKGISISKDIFGDKHPEYFTSLENYATFCVKSENAENAGNAEETLMAILNSSSDVNSLDYANIANTLGVFYESIGNYQKAELFLLSALQIRKEKLEHNHPDYIRSLYNVGTLYASLEDYINSLNYFDEIFSQPITKEIENIYISAFHEFGLIAAKTNNFTTAEKWLLRALEMTKSKKGLLHPDCIEMYNNIASLYSDKKEYTLSEDYFSIALKLTNKIYGENSIKALTILVNQIVLQLRQNAKSPPIEVINKTNNLSK